MWAIIDGSNWAHLDVAGDEDWAIENFLRRVNDVKRRHDFTRIVIAFDSYPSWRKRIFPDYKSGRPEKPDSFYRVLGELKSRIKESPYEYYELPGYEADDLIGQRVGDALEEGEKAVVFSSDRDYHQLLVAGSITQCTKVTREFHGNLMFDFVTAERLQKRFGIKPWQWVDYKCMAGDASDKLPGCPGIGEDTARKILRGLPSLDEFCKRSFEVHIGPKRRQALLEFCRAEDGLELHRKLIRLAPELAPIAAYTAGGNL